VLCAQDVLQEFSGKWELRPVSEAGKVVGTQAVLHQAILPKGVFI